MDKPEGMSLRAVGGLIAVALLLTLASACGGDDDGASTTPSSTADAAGTTAPAGDRETASSAPTDAPTVTPTPIPGPAPGEDPPGDQLLYLALGDSLSEGIGASDEKRTAWVPLVAIGLGDEYELLNLGVAGDDSEELIEDGPLDTALTEIANRANDGVPGNEVAVITLEIGGNDLLDLYFDLVIPGTCPSVDEALQRPECVEALEDALADYQPNLQYTIDQLQAAAPGVPIYLMTLYNPFSGGGGNLDRIGVLALEGEPGTPFPDGLNDVIREFGSEPDVHIVEWYELFIGRQNDYIYQDLIHPNDTGHRVMADAVLAAMGR